MTATILQFPKVNTPRTLNADTRRTSPAFAVGGIDSPARVQPVAAPVTPIGPARSVLCADWDSFEAQPMHDSSGRCIGTLAPRATLEQLGAGIQGWSRPDHDTRHDS